jgi:hypothetical protein
MNLYENNVLTDSDISLSASTLPVNPIFVLARGSVSGSPQYFTNWEFDFFGIHKSLTANQATDLYDAITTYNTAVR